MQLIFPFIQILQIVFHSFVQLDNNSIKTRVVVFGKFEVRTNLTVTKLLGYFGEQWLITQLLNVVLSGVWSRLPTTVFRGKARAFPGGQTVHPDNQDKEGN